MNSRDSRQIPEKVLRVLEVLESLACDYKLRTFETPAHHAKQAAELLECHLGAVVKSLVFEVNAHESFLLVLVSGQNRVDGGKLSKIVGDKVFPAKPDRVLLTTGYPVGAVPPFGLTRRLPVIIDNDLLEFEYLWASAGSKNTLVKFKSSILSDITGGRVCDIKEDQSFVS